MNREEWEMWCGCLRVQRKLLEPQQEGRISVPLGYGEAATGDQSEVSIQAHPPFVEGA